MKSDVDHIAKQEQLRREIAIGDEQLKNGQYTEYDVGDLDRLVEEVLAEGQKRLAARRANTPAEEH